MFEKQRVVSVLDVPGFVHHSRATHVRNFSNTGGLSAPPGVNSTVPNFVPRTNPDGVGLNSVSCNASRCCTSLLLLSALGAHSVQVVDSPFVRNSKSAEVHPSWGFNSPSRHQPKSHVGRGLQGI